MVSSSCDSTSILLFLSDLVFFKKIVLNILAINFFFNVVFNFMAYLTIKRRHFRDLQCAILGNEKKYAF